MKTDRKLARKESVHILSSTLNPLFHLSTQYHSAKPSIPSLNTVPHGNRRKACKERARPHFELNAEPSVPPINTVPRGSQMDSLWKKRWGFRAQCKTFYSITQHGTTWKPTESLQGKSQSTFWARHGTLSSTSQRSTTRRSDGKLVRKEAGLTAQCKTFYSITQHSTTWKLGRNEAGLRAEYETLCSTSQHSTTWRSDGKLVKKEVRGL